MRVSAGVSTKGLFTSESPCVGDRDTIAPKRAPRNERREYYVIAR